MYAPFHEMHTHLLRTVTAAHIKKYIMQFSEARQVISPLGSIRIFRLAQEASWRCVLSETSVDLLRDARSGLASTNRTYASDIFLQTFCDEANLLPRPPEDDLFLIPFDALTIYDPRMVQTALVIWSNNPSLSVSQGQLITSMPITYSLDEIVSSPNDFLETVSFDFRAPLRLPSGELAPESVRSWSYGLTRKQLTYEQHRFCDELAGIFRSPASTHKPISASYAANVLDTLRKLWGISMNHLGFSEMQTRSFRIFDPLVLGYYFRYLANENEGRGQTQSALETERQCLKHLLRGMKTLAIRNCLGLRVDDLPHNLRVVDVVNFLDYHVKNALLWVPNKGRRKRNREDVASGVSNSSFTRWADRVKEDVRALMGSEGPHTRKSENLAKKIQDLFVQAMLGARYGPQRADVLQSLVIGSRSSSCAVPLCEMAGCKGNRVLAYGEYTAEFGESDAASKKNFEETGYAYFIVVGHAKNYTLTSRRAQYTGPTVHTPERLGREVQYLLHHLVTWSSGLLRDLNEGGSEFAHRYAIVNYSVGGHFDSQDTQARFSKYVQWITAPEVGVTPCTFRFLFVRKIEISISERIDNHQQAESLRAELAGQMCTSLQQWHSIYSRPAPSLPKPGHQLARNIAFGD